MVLKFEPVFNALEQNIIPNRFLIIGDREVYHLGVFLIDLGKPWFTFSKLDKTAVNELLTIMN